MKQAADAVDYMPRCLPLVAPMVVRNGIAHWKLNRMGEHL